MKLAAILFRSYLLFSSIWLQSCSRYSSDVELIENDIKNNIQYIIKYCDQYNVNPYLYISIVYAELYLNKNVLDDFDEPRARVGQDPSIGFAQMRVSTAIWLENILADSILSRSIDRYEVVDKLMNNEINIKYSVCYVSVIQSKINNNVAHKNAIVASYYAKGIDIDGVIDTSYTNKFGRFADEYYQSGRIQSYIK